MGKELGKLEIHPLEGFKTAPILLRQEDKLFFHHAGSLASVVIGIRGRMMLNDGTVRPLQTSFSVSSNRAFATTYFNPGEGWLLSLVVYVVAGTPSRGQVYVHVGIYRGLDGFDSIVQTLAADYVEQTLGVSWPGGPIRGSTEGNGMPRSIAGTNPAAGAEISEAVPANARWLLRAMTAALVTDGTGANRRVHLVVDDGTNILFRSVAGSNQTATLTHQYNIGAHGLTAAVIALEQFIPIPINLLLIQTWRVRTATDAIVAGDDWGAPQLLVEEWIEE